MEDEFSRVVDALPGMVWTALSGGRIDYVNRRWCEYTGLGVDEARGFGWQAVIHPEDLPQLLERWTATVNVPGDMEARIRRVDGTYRWFLLRMSRLDDASGRATKWCGVTTDIEDRGLRGAYALDYRARWWLSRAAREGHFSSIDDGIPALAALMKPGGGVEHANRHALEYFGATLEALKDWVTADTVHPQDLTAVLAAWEASVATAQPYDVVARRRRADGAYRWFHMRRFPLLDTEGAVYFWYIFETDVDDLKRAEDLLAGEKRLLDLVARGHPMPGILEALCQLVESTVGGCYCSVVLVDASGTRLEHGAAPSLPASFIASIVGRPVNAESGPCAMAAHLNEQIAAPDLTTETRWQEYSWCAMALEHGLRACWSTPIASADGKVLGAFAIYYDKQTAPKSVDQSLIQQFTHLASIAIERTRSEDERKRSEALLAGEKRLLEMVAGTHSLPFVLDALCRLVEETAGGGYCGILFFSPAGTTWQVGAAPTLPAGYNEAMHGRPAHRESGPCGLAAYLKTPVIVADLEADLRWDKHGFRTLALSHGLRSCWSSPILSQDQQALGALAIYQREPGIPSSFQNELIAQITHIASIAVERSRSEGALRRSEAFLAEAQRLSATGSFSWRVSTSEISWSKQAHRIWGFDEGKPATLNQMASRAHPEDRAMMEGMIESMRVDGGDFECEHRLQMPDSSVKFLHLVAHGTQDQDGGLEYVGAVQDVTERRLADETLGRVRSELAHMVRVTSLGALTASIAHEVNQPLSGIITNASTCLRMLSAEPPNVLGALETARRTIRDGNRASDVITRLRALFSKKSAATDAVDLNEAAREVLALTWSELQRSRVVLRSELADDLRPVAGDRVQLQQVILNLLLNAADAMSEVNDRPRDLLIFTAMDEDGRVRLTVQDAGTGLDPQGVDRLFESFYTTKSEGMGMGLSVCRSIIESHQGSLWATSNSGPGAAFSFSIPCKHVDVTDSPDLGATRLPVLSDARRVAGMT